MKPIMMYSEQYKQYQQHKLKKKKDDYPFSCFVSAFLAKMMSISAKVLLPIQRFWPFKCQPPGTLQNNNQHYNAVQKGHIVVITKKFHIGLSLKKIIIPN